MGPGTHMAIRAADVWGRDWGVLGHGDWEQDKQDRRLGSLGQRHVLHVSRYPMPTHLPGSSIPPHPLRRPHLSAELFQSLPPLSAWGSMQTLCEPSSAPFSPHLPLSLLPSKPLGVIALAANLIMSHPFNPTVRRHKNKSQQGQCCLALVHSEASYVTTAALSRPPHPPPGHVLRTSQ